MRAVSKYASHWFYFCFLFLSAHRHRTAERRGNFDLASGELRPCYYMCSSFCLISNTTRLFNIYGVCWMLGRSGINACEAIFQPCLRLSRRFLEVEYMENVYSEMSKTKGAFPSNASLWEISIVFTTWCLKSTWLDRIKIFILCCFIWREKLILHKK